MAGSSKNANTSFAIIFASILLSGSLVFLGIQSGGGSDVSEDLMNDMLASMDRFNDFMDEVEEQAVPSNDGGSHAAAPTVAVSAADFVDDDPFQGDEDAPVTIVEFSDYECPFCSRFYTDTLDQIREKYIDTGKVKFVYRDFPLQFHPQAMPAAIFAECVDEQAGDEAFFAVHDEIFEAFANGSGFNYNVMSNYAADLGIDTEALRTCYDNQEMEAEVNKDKADGARAGIQGTPGFLINGQVLSGAQPFSVFEQVIEAEL